MASTGKRPKRRQRKSARKAAKRKGRSPPKRKRAKTVPAPKRTRTRAPKRKPKAIPKRKVRAKRKLVEQLRTIKRGEKIKRKRKRKRKRTSAERARYEALRSARAAAVRRARREEREGRAHGLGDVEVIDTDGADVRSDYRPYPIPDHAPEEIRWAEVPADAYRDAMNWLEDIFGKSDDHAAADAEEIEWFPTFDEVYDYIDALVDEYDLDAHELFEMAFGYSDEAAA